MRLPVGTCEGSVALTQAGRTDMLAPHAADSADGPTGTSLLAERGIEVDHVTIHRWGRRVAPLLVDAAGLAGIGSETAGVWTSSMYVKVTGRWVYLYRAVDQFGQVIDMYASTSPGARRLVGSSAMPGPPPEWCRWGSSPTGHPLSRSPN